jgi:serine/threonine-protein kinase PpkA
MSTVYLAIQLSVGREVALKIMSPALNSDPVFSERFQREANIVGQLSHPNIVSVYDIGRYKSLNYIAMDYLPGGSLHDKMASSLGTHEVLRIMKEISGALEHAHNKGYIHRDIKPENILFREDGTAVLSDFGVAKAVSTSTQTTNAGMVVGTPHYMSPEQARGKSIDGRSDIYSLGIVFYEMLTGSIPFQADDAVAVAIKHLTAPIPNLPAQYALFQSTLNKLLAKEPDDRFQQGQQVIDAMDDTQNRRSPNYISGTESSTIQALSLLKALIIIVSLSLGEQTKKILKWIFSWRWLPNRGIYRRSNHEITKVSRQGNELNTIISTRIHRAVHHQGSVNKKSNSSAKYLLLILVVLIAWGAFSLSVTRLSTSTRQLIPESVQNVAKSTTIVLHNLLKQTARSEKQVSISPKQEEPLRNPALNNKSIIDQAKSLASTINTPKLKEKTSLVLLENDKQKIMPEQPKPRKYSLSVTAKPINADIKIMNIPDRYYSDIPLIPGRYQIQVSKEGYDLYEEWIDISNEKKSIIVNLKKQPTPGSIFHNVISKGEKGPAMVIIPSGSFIMGNKNSSSTAPERRVYIEQPFAVSQYEITFSDYEKFARATNNKTPNHNGWGKGSRPVINVSWEKATDYAAWLKKVTGKKYRLLSESEWEYIARAGSTSDYWWGNEKVGDKANCRRGCDTQHTTFFNTKTTPVGFYKPNPFKLYDTAGNVAEWVQDCYVDHYLGAPKNTSAVSKKYCQQRSVRGGSVKTTEKTLTSFARDKRQTNKNYTDVGFRIAVDLY